MRRFHSIERYKVVLSMSAITVGVLSAVYLTSSVSIIVAQKVTGDYIPGIVEAHVHQFDKVSSAPATCTMPGTTTYKCNICGETKVTETTKALGHKYSNQTIEPPTCLEEGSETISCVRCGRTLKEKIPALGHSFTYVTKTEPTCTTDGVATSRKCSRCSFSESGNFKIPALGHDYSEIITDTPMGHKRYMYKCKRNDSEFVDWPRVNYTKLEGYKSLSKNYSNGSKYAKFYADCFKACEKYLLNIENDNRSFISVDFDGSLKSSEVWCVFQQLRHDNPQFYFLWDYSIGYGSGNYANLGINLSNEFTKGNLRHDIHEAVKAYSTACYPAAKSSNPTSYIHEFICLNNYYDNEVLNNKDTFKKMQYHQEIVGPMLYGKSVCAGYAATFQYLSYLYGVDAITVAGRGGDDYHAWNYVRSGSSWKGVDVTWDDGKYSEGWWLWKKEYEFKTDYLMMDLGKFHSEHTPGTNDMNVAYSQKGTGKEIWKNRFNAILI